MAFFTINDTLHQKHLFSTTLCSKYSSTFHYSSSHFHTSHKKSTLFVDKAKNINSNWSTKAVNVETFRENGCGVSSFRPRNERDGPKLKENIGEIGLVEGRFTNDVYTKKMVDSRNRSKHANLGLNLGLKNNNSSLVNGKINKNIRRIDKNSKVVGDGDDKKQKGSRRRVVDPKEFNWKETLNMCSKRGDVMGAIDWYDEARKKGIEMGQYYYTVLLYLCSSAATGVVRPAKSGSGSRTSSLNVSKEVSTLSSLDYRDMSKRDFDSVESNREDKNVNFKPTMKEVEKKRSSRNSNTTSNLADESVLLRENDVADMRNGNEVPENFEILVSEEIKKYALDRGFEIYERMHLEKIPMNEATLTSVGRMAMSMGDGDMAFDMVKQMTTLGISPRLRSYGPALSAYCNSGDSSKAFVVEKHMLEHGVEPEEPELEALLRASIDDCKSDKIYYLLHKLRSSVRKVSPCVAKLIEKWFMSMEASKVGKRKPDKKIIKEAIDKRGGGWHGEGWIGQGKWIVSHSTVADDGVCKCCGEKLTTIDLDPVETENFAKSVASIATRREKKSSFQNFQKWLDYYGPFEAVVDAANVGLFSQKRFIPSKISAVVNGIRQTLPSKKWPLIILHNRRVTGQKMDEPVNKALVEKWKIADALYPTPTGSNDDWYWLYAAIKFKCLLVTNDEMRDHTFQLLGNDFFPKWKERHQVHFDFSDTGPIFHMPPPCSIVIQESESGHWHIPVASEHDYEEERTWLCVTRSNSIMKKQGSITTSRGSDIRNKVQTPENQEVSKKPQQKDNYTNLRNILSESVFPDNSTTTVRTEIEAAEVLGNCTIDFQI